MKLISPILLGAVLALAGCGDPVGAPADRFWMGRGAVLFTQGLGLDSAGTVATIGVDGNGGATLFAGTIPCPPRMGKVVYADATVNKTNWAIYLANADGSGAAQLLVGDSGTQRPNFGVVDLSATASKVIYVLYDFLLSKSYLYVINADGTGKTLVSDKVVSSTAAVFSPTGDSVAFYAGTGKNELTVVDLAKLSSVVVARNARPWSIENLDWSSDGRIVYVGGEGSQNAGVRNIYSVKPDGTELATLTSDTDQDNRWPVWSPDGARLAYIHGKEIWTMSADGSSRRQVTYESAWPYQIKMFPQWSADQSMILFTAVAGNGVQGLLQVVDLGTLRVNALATGAARGFWR